MSRLATTVASSAIQRLESQEWFTEPRRDSVTSGFSTRCKSSAIWPALKHSAVARKASNSACVISVPPMISTTSPASIGSRANTPHPWIGFTIEEQVAEGDTVVTKFRHIGVWRVGFEGAPPTGEEEGGGGIRIHRISGGKITEEWSMVDSRPVQEHLDHMRREHVLIEQDLRVARGIQHASLPKDVPTLAGWQINPFYQPAREVGGDFYDFHLLSEGRLGVVTGDATGKGVPAALVMSTTCGMLQAVSQTLDASSPGKVLEQVNETLVARIPPNMFVTCFYAVLEPKSASLSYANAGHDLPYLWRGGAAEELMARGMPLGLMAGM